MPTAHLYSRDSQAFSVSAQQAVMEEFLASSKWSGLEVAHFVDTGATADVRFSRRPAGGAAGYRAREGDVVVIAKSALAFTSGLDMLQALTTWHRNGAEVFALDLPC